MDRFGGCANGVNSSLLVVGGCPEGLLHNRHRGSGKGGLVTGLVITNGAYGGNYAKQSCS
eukprot:scaffold24826_cov89-Skeletonema_marinoi.AAC.2